MTTSVDPRCSIYTSTVGTGSAVEVTGTLDWHSAPMLRSSLSSLPAGGRLVIDLSEVSRIDSAGTGELIAATVRARHAGVEMAIVTADSTADILNRVGISDSALVFSDRARGYTWVSGERAVYPLGR